MSSRMVSRGGKTRFIGFVCMILVLSAVLYVFHETQAELDGVRHSASSCGRQLESVSSQLQGTINRMTGNLFVNIIIFLLSSC